MADYEVVNNVGVITCRNPPVNQLSYRLRKGMSDGLNAAIKDPNVVAVVLVGGGKSFPAGADVKFRYPRNKLAPFQRCRFVHIKTQRVRHG